MDIVVLCGGLSNERDVSISSGTDAARALRSRGHRVLLVDLFFGFEGDLGAGRAVFDQPQEDLHWRVGEQAPDLQELGSVRERVLAFLPKFDLYIADRYVGFIRKEFTFFKPSFQLDFNGWRVDGDWMEWDYTILDAYGRRVASVSKELWNWTDTYVLDIAQPQDALCVLMIVLAIDAEKCSRDNN